MKTNGLSSQKLKFISKNYVTVNSAVTMVVYKNRPRKMATSTKKCHE